MIFTFKKVWTSPRLRLFFLSRYVVVVSDGRKGDACENRSYINGTSPWPKFLWTRKYRFFKCGLLFFLLSSYFLLFSNRFCSDPPITTPTISRTPPPLRILSRVAAMKVELKIPNPTSLHGCQLLDQLSCPRLITLKIRCQSSMQHNSSAQKLVKPAAELPDFGEFVACVCVGVFIISFLNEWWR